MRIKLAKELFRSDQGSYITYKGRELGLLVEVGPLTASGVTVEILDDDGEVKKWNLKKTEEVSLYRYGDNEDGTSEESLVLSEGVTNPMEFKLREAPVFRRIDLLQGLPVGTLMMVMEGPYEGEEVLITGLNRAELKTEHKTEEMSFPALLLRTGSALAATFIPWVGEEQK